MRAWLLLVALLGALTASFEARADNEITVEVDVDTGKLDSHDAAMAEARRKIDAWWGPFRRDNLPADKSIIWSPDYRVESHRSWHYYIPIGFGESLPGVLFGTMKYSVGKVKVRIRVVN